MKKLMSVFALCGAMFLTACDSNAGAQNGDTVIIDFAGYKDGVAFDGGTATNYPLVLGSGQFVPGFEEQLVGMEKGEARGIKRGKIETAIELIKNKVSREIIEKSTGLNSKELDELFAEKV